MVKNIKHLKTVKRKLGIKKRQISKTSFLRKKRERKFPENIEHLKYFSKQIYQLFR